jgi:hypothetical protein
MDLPGEPETYVDFRPPEDWESVIGVATEEKIKEHRKLMLLVASRRRWMEWAEERGLKVRTLSRKKRGVFRVGLYEAYDPETGRPIERWSDGQILGIDEDGTIFEMTPPPSFEELEEGEEEEEQEPW